MLVAPPLTAQAADVLSEGRARAAAISILQGDPYGRTPADVAQNIVASQLLTGGSKRCGGKATKPVWEFHVVVPANRNPNGSPIDGYLVIDARTGKMTCAGLPLLD
ncbi:MAG: hypothetical protein HXX15_00460 [Rhodopseudomonas sp.]|uniref:hypothetical protein n=1 Tax=Rhodopseudomonas sp. TaxID=1078 RepID=UPI00183C43E7|nr:hypothetical protein [Rhodopseudomonas sp.]NVN84533.1 hypothetical protein [Rhodopseudomonas sp.]